MLRHFSGFRNFSNLVLLTYTVRRSFFQDSDTGKKKKKKKKIKVEVVSE